MTSTTPTEPEALAACPFCGEIPTQAAPGLNFQHPDNDCFYGPSTIRLDKMAAWNRRSPTARMLAGEGEAVAPMPETDDREGFGCLPYSTTPLPYNESDRDWADRNNEAVAWLADNHRAIRSALAHPPAAEPVGVREAIAEIAANLSADNPVWTAGCLADALTARGIGFLPTPARTDDAGEVDPELIDRVKYAVERPDAQGFLLAKASMTRHDFRRILAALSPAPDRGEGEA